MKVKITFVTRAKRYGTVEAVFEYENMAKKMAMEDFKSEKWWLFPMYMGRRLVRIRVGAIPSYVKPEWIVTTIVMEIKLDYEIVNTNRTKVVNWWGYGVEIFVTIAKDFRDLPQIIMCVGRSLNVVIEGCPPPMCFNCHQTGHIQNKRRNRDHTSDCTDSRKHRSKLERMRNTK